MLCECRKQQQWLHTNKKPRQDKPELLTQRQSKNITSGCLADLFEQIIKERKVTISCASDMQFDKAICLQEVISYLAEPLRDQNDDSLEWWKQLSAIA